MFVRPDEKPFLSRELVEAFTFTGTAEALRDRVAELRDAGYSQLTIQLVEGQEDALEDWAEVLRPLGLRKSPPKRKAPPKKKRR
jgi:5,10-methylenetetrahydromethanopterin reductase